MEQQQNVFFWGAGATAALGIRTTVAQTKFIGRITGADAPSKSLKSRVADALDSSNREPWYTALLDLITILGDTESGYGSIHLIDNVQMEAMRRNWRRGANEDELRGRIIELRLIYDWPALKSVVRICPGSSTNNLSLNDLFNLLDMHISPASGFRAITEQVSGGKDCDQETEFFDARRLLGAKNALAMILLACFYIDYQVCIESKKVLVRQYHDFATLLARRLQRDGMGIAGCIALDRPAFYKGDVSFASLNYDPIALWVQFVANREMNNRADVPHIGSPAVPLQIFHDFGHLIPARRIERGPSNWPWYPMNEAAAQRLNEKPVSDHRVRLIKFLFPHGCLCWRECPDCGKLSAYHGDRWSVDSAGLFPPPPLMAFDTYRCPDWIKDPERTQREKGKVDARACLHCGTFTYAHHTQAVMQSSFKSRPPSFIEEIQRDLRATTMQANHIILMGYSLPPDDVTFRAFFSARRQRAAPSVTVVGKDDDNPDWYDPKELATRTLGTSSHSTVQAAWDIFGKDKVRFYGGGVPNVFLDGGSATAAKLEQLLNWSSVPVT